jgi:hypothetical protein
LLDGLTMDGASDAGSVERGGGAPSWPWVNRELRHRLHRWFAQWYRADAEDLADSVVLQLVRRASRAPLRDDDLQKLAWKIARDVRCDHAAVASRRVTSLEMEPPDVPRERSRSDTRDALRALRTRLVPLLGTRQCELLGLILDEDVVSYTMLAQRLRTDRKRIHEMVRGIGKRVLRISVRHTAG